MSTEVKNISFEDEGIKAAHQIQGITDDGVLRNVRVNDSGRVLVVSEGSEASSSGATEKTIAANVMTLNTEEQTIGVEQTVTKISIANFSETANVTVYVDEISFVIAPNLIVDLQVNTSSNIGLSSTEADTLIQYILTGKV